MINLHKYVGDLHKLVELKVNIELPEKVEKCPICKGFGHYNQTYNAGCGMGFYRSSGPCDYCYHPKLYMCGSGFVYKNSNFKEKSIPESVLVQIYEANKATIETIKQLENARITQMAE